MTNEMTLINQDDEKNSTSKLKSYYDLGLIPPEKKAYLTQLRDSVGPFMGIQSESGGPHYMLDAASQIATLGLGLNPAPFFGTSHHLESWLNDKTGPDMQKLRCGLESFFKRKLNWQQVHTTLCHSGAEANELALGYCYKYRHHKKANKIIAFEGSFHGRMMVSLSCTWNPDKRVPFEWPGFEAKFNPYPESRNGDLQVEIPEKWRSFWDKAPNKKFSPPKEWTSSSDSLLADEVMCLTKLRDQLLKRDLFAIIIEPMQCEGGDRYSTNRFHTALLLMARAFHIPVIYDEVQTGFHLGREFFWHKQFDLQDDQGHQLSPDYIVCAKKAQVGMVITHCDVKNHVHEAYSVASMVRGTHHALALDQAQEKICELENKAKKHLETWSKKYQKFLERPRTCGLSFAIDLKDKSHVPTFIAQRFKHGLLYYPAGSQTLRFRLNLAFSESDLRFLFEQLDLISKEVFLGEKVTLRPTLSRQTNENDSQQELYAWHEKLIEYKISPHHHTTETLFGFINDRFNHLYQAKVKLITSQNFEQYREEIIKIQKNNYELSRQTEIGKFEAVAQNKKGLGLILERGNQIVGIAFAGPLELFAMERGVRKDPYYSDPHTLYMLDTTIDKGHQGKGLGRYLKYALTLLAMDKGIQRIQGRNRDRMASSMLSINLSLGAYEQSYTPEDYLDFEKHRDVLYYTTPLVWKKNEFKLSHAIDMPLGSASNCQINWIKEQLPVLTNKVCLSNFVSERFLNHLRELSDMLPKELRHLYSASGQSEAVDKIAKSLWYFSDKKTYRMLTFEGHEFGRGGFLARSLSEKDDPYFPVTKLPHPNEDNFMEVLSMLEEALDKQEHLAVWIEPLLQNTMQRVPATFLVALKELCRQKQVKLVFNETASSSYRYHKNEFFLSNDEEFTPDIGFAYASGQAAYVFTKKENFLEKPLMLISTWDGDEFALGQYLKAAKELSASNKERIKMQELFQSNLLKILKHYPCYDIELENGVGHFKGEISHELAQFFKRNNGAFIVCPSFEQMKDFNAFAPHYLKGL